MRVHSGLPAAFLLAFLSASASAGESPDFAAAESFIVDAVESGRIPSAAVAVLHNGELVWSAGFGMADLAAQRPATADTPFWLASVSKPITATALMTLVDAGKIDLDKPANTYLAGAKLRAYAGDSAAMTVRTLLNHTSGLPTHWNFFYDGVAPYTIDEAIRRHGFAATVPGTVYNYSNLGFGILNQISENVSGRAWSEFMTQTLFEPAAMKNTSTWGPDASPDAYARPYSRLTSGQFAAIGFYHFDHPGASTIWSSAHDLIRFARLHLNDGEIDGTRVLAADTIRAMRTLAPDGSGETPENGYALGWAIGTYRGVRSFTHNGGMPGASTSLSIFPESNSAIVVLTNCSYPAFAGAIETQLKRALFPEAKRDQPARERNADEAAGPDLTGKWTGIMAHHDGDVPLTFMIDEKGTVNVRFAEMPVQVLDNVTLDDGLRGTCSGVVDAYRHFHGLTQLSFELRHEEESLRGVLYATAEGYFRVPYWVEVKR